MRRLVLIATLLCSVGSGAQDWGPLQFLVGHWKGEGATTDQGAGSGAFSFTPDLRGKVLLRRSFAEYPAANGKPGYRHDDLMIIYRDSASKDLQAIYFDNEEHIIHYSIRPVGNGVEFLSAEPSGAARFRLTYTGAGADRLKVKFDIAPPGKDFATYIEASARREGQDK